MITGRTGVQAFHGGLPAKSVKDIFALELTAQGWMLHAMQIMCVPVEAHGFSLVSGARIGRCSISLSKPSKALAYYITEFWLVCKDSIVR